MNNIYARMKKMLPTVLPFVILLIVTFLPLCVLVGYLVFTTNEDRLTGVREVSAQGKEGEGSGKSTCELGKSNDPAWTKINEYDQYFAKAAKEFRFDPNAANILKSMAMIESGGAGHTRADGSVIEGCDQYGGGCAVGIMQIKPAIWGGKAREIGADLYTAEGSIRTAAKLMAEFTRETGSWENAITQKYHPGTGQYGLTQGGYVTTVKEYLRELGAADCADTSDSSNGSSSTGSSTDESSCVITKVGDPRTSPTIPPSCGAQAGDYHNPLAKPNEIDNLNKIVTSINTEMGSYGGYFEYGGHSEHAGLDIGTHVGTRPPVYAVTDGTVTAIENHDGVARCEDAVSGCTLRLEHDDDEYTTEYVHVNPTVQVGQQVQRGDRIGLVHIWLAPYRGNDHLHFELRLTANRYNINPRIYFPEFEQFPIASDYFGDVRKHSASRGIFLEEDGGDWAEKFRDHPPCPPADRNGDGVVTDADCWAM